MHSPLSSQDIASMRVTAPVGDDPYRSIAYGWYVVGLFTAIQACNMVDRSVMALVLEPLRREFGLTDGQLGTLSGIMFGSTYALFSLVYATFIDRTVRRTFLAIMIAAWSVCTGLSGAVHSVILLAIARLGVGAFEAAGSPTIMSMIPDIIPRERRSTAMGVFFLSGPIGVVITFLIGGIIVSQFGWRAAFFVATIPGLILAPLVLFTVKEPVRGAKEDMATDTVASQSQGLAAAARHLIRTPTLWMLLLGMGLSTTAASAVGTWIASFFIRVHHLELSSIGVLIAVAFGLFGSSGSAIWGWLSDRLAHRHEHWRLTMGTIALLLTMVLGQVMSFVQTLPAAMALFCAYCFFGIGYMAPLYGVFATITPPQMRGATMFLMTIVTTSIGYGVGPWLCGLLSDAFGGASSLQYAFATMLMLDLAATALIITVNRRIVREAP